MLFYFYFLFYILFDFIFYLYFIYSIYILFYILFCSILFFERLLSQLKGGPEIISLEALLRSSPSNEGICAWWDYSSVWMVTALSFKTGCPFTCKLPGSGFSTASVAVAGGSPQAAAL